MSERTAGQIIEGLGVTVDSLAEDAMVSDALVLMKCIDPEGAVSLFMAHSEGMSWLERLGMLRAAELMEGPSGRWETT